MSNYKNFYPPQTYSKEKIILDAPRGSIALALGTPPYCGVFFKKEFHVGLDGRGYRLKAVYK